MQKHFYAGTTDGTDYGFSSSKDDLLPGWVELTKEEYLYLLEQNSKGKNIVFEDYKKPKAVDYRMPEKEKIMIEKRELKQYLSDTDYIAAKLAEGVATKEEYATELQKRQQARDRINEIDKLLS